MNGCRSASEMRPAGTARLGPMRRVARADWPAMIRRPALVIVVAVAAAVGGGCEHYEYVNGLTCRGGRVTNMAVDLQTPMSTPDAAQAYAAAAAGLPQQ